MVVSFDIEAETGDCYRVILSSGEDAFFAGQWTNDLFNNEIEIVEIDLERLSGSNATSLNTLKLIAEGIGNCFRQNDKAILYYYCDDLMDVPKSQRKNGMWPQEYRSQLFGLMFKRFVSQHETEDIKDITIIIYDEDRPLHMHLIARDTHSKYIEILKEYVITHYGK